MPPSLSPSAQLDFSRPLTALSTRPLVLSNPNSFPVGFKVKTTSPSRFCVKPNAGRIEPGQKAAVQVMHLALSAEPQADAKSADKFLIQSAQIPASLASVSHMDFWTVLEKQDKTSIRQQKLRVNYLPPVASASSTPKKPPAALVTTKAAPTAAAGPSPFQVQLQNILEQVKANVNPLIAIAVIASVVVLGAAVGAAIYFDVVNL